MIKYSFLIMTKRANFNLLSFVILLLIVLLLIYLIKIEYFNG